MGKVIQNKKGQTTITIPKALVDSLKLEKGMKYEIIVGHHSEIVVRFDKGAEFEEEVKEENIPEYFG